MHSAIQQRLQDSCKLWVSTFSYYSWFTFVSFEKVSVRKWTSRKSQKVFVKKFTINLRGSWRENQSKNKTWEDRLCGNWPKTWDLHEEDDHKSTSYFIESHFSTNHGENHFPPLEEFVWNCQFMRWFLICYQFEKLKTRKNLIRTIIQPSYCFYLQTKHLFSLLKLCLRIEE